MILTYKIKHNYDLKQELQKAKQVAEFAINNKTLSSKDVKHLGLKSIISNQILRKYARNRKCKKVNRVNLIIPAQSIRVNRDACMIKIASLKLEFGYKFRNDFEKINQIEINQDTIFVSVTIREETQIKTNKVIGVDLNATSHIAVMSDLQTGKVLKLGKSAGQIRKTYQSLRRKSQKKRKFRKLKKLKQRESKRIRDLNHKVSKKIVMYAKKSNSKIVMENLYGIRDSVNRSKKFIKRLKCIVNNWSFYQLKQFIEYKARLHGIEVIYIDPHNTSKACSRCGLIGNREKKLFKCPECGHADHADVNAGFNIALAGIAAIT